MKVEKGKKELVYFMEVDTERLMEELYAAVPALKPVIHDDGSFDINLRLFTSESKLILLVPKDLDEYRINEVVRMHEIYVEEEGEIDAISNYTK